MTDYSKFGMIEVETCPFCQGHDFNLFKTVHSAPTLGINFCGGMILMTTMSSFVMCSGCGMVIQSPRMTDERIEQYYKTGTYRKHLGRSEEFIYKNELVRAARQLDYLKSLDITIDSHIDIGSGNGYFSQVVCDHYKIEPATYDLAVDDAVPDATYDLVSSNHCLEHTTDPVAALAMYRRLCKKYLLLEVPGYAVTVQDLHGLGFPHLWNFPSKVLFAMVEEAGFKILQSETEPETRIFAEIK